jgi:hypothetical protein
MRRSGSACHPSDRLSLLPAISLPSWYRKKPLAKSYGSGPLTAKWSVDVHHFPRITETGGEGRVRYRERLGGLLRCYREDAA